VSPYAYCGNNPVKLVDPDGREIWKPDETGNLIAEKGDNAMTLAAFLNCSVEEASLILSGQGYDSKTTITAGSKIILDNVYTRSIASFRNADEDYYNCWGSAYRGVLGLPIENGVGISCATTFDSYLSNNFESVDATEAQFGKTIIRFEEERPYAENKFDNYVKHGCVSRQPGTTGSISHAAVYYGKSNDGTVYVYTKNGYPSKPKVVPLHEMQDYGRVKGIGGCSGYYNNPK